jgi:hypothetical protein
MTLLYPIYLWSLFLLIIPIAVHLFSKNNPRRIKIGSVKFLKQTESQTFRRITFHDAWLFALRALIFALLSFLITMPEIACKYRASEKGWILIEPTFSLEAQSTEFQKTIDSLVKAGYDMRFLEPNFPTTSRTTQENAVMDMWSLLAEADKINRDTLAFFVASSLRESSLQGKRPTLSRQVQWLETSADETAWIERISQLSDDSLFIVIAISSANETRFEHLIARMPDKSSVVPPIELIKQGDSIGVSLISNPNEKKWFSLTKSESWCIVYDERFANVLPYFERAVKAIAQFSPTKISVEVKKETEWQEKSEAKIIWLCKRKPPKHLKCLDATGFSEESLLDEHFVNTLSEMLLPESTSENDRRKASSEMAMPITRHEQQTSNEQRTSLMFPIWILVTLLVGLERWIAFSKE